MSSSRALLPIFVPPPSPETLKAREVHRRLTAFYNAPIAWFHHLDPVSELISLLLSHRTRNADSGRAFHALRDRYADWAALRDAPTAEVEALIKDVTWPEQKAPRIQEALRVITTRRKGDLNLDFLARLPVTEARAWLESIPGVGPKTSAGVMLFSTLRRPALPVDSHHHRVAQRVGMIAPSLAVGDAHAVLEEQLPEGFTAQDFYDNHEVMMFHGQRCCFYQAPACGRCPLYDLCPEGKRRHPELTDAANDT